MVVSAEAGVAAGWTEPGSAVGAAVSEGKIGTEGVTGDLTGSDVTGSTRGAASDDAAATAGTSGTTGATGAAAEAVGAADV